MGKLLQFTGNANLPTNPADLANIGAAVAVTANSGVAGNLLRMQRDGLWVYGAENTQVEEGSTWAINPHSFQHGYCCWSDGKLAGEVMVPISSPLPPRSGLKEVIGPVRNDRGQEIGEEVKEWTDQLMFDLVCLDGEDEGTAVTYKTNSVGGKNAIGAVATAIGARAQSGAKDVVPVVKLEVDHYTHRKWGKIYTPELTIVDWLTMEGPAAEGGDSPEQEVVEEAEAIQAPVEDSAPTEPPRPGRRRRR